MYRVTIRICHLITDHAETTTNRCGAYFTFGRSAWTNFALAHVLVSLLLFIQLHKLT